MSGTVWDWYDSRMDDSVEVTVRAGVVDVYAEASSGDRVSLVLPPDLAEEFARALLEAAAQVRAMGDVPTP